MLVIFQKRPEKRKKEEGMAEPMEKVGHSSWSSSFLKI